MRMRSAPFWLWFTVRRPIWTGEKSSEIPGQASEDTGDMLLTDNLIKFCFPKDVVFAGQSEGRFVAG